MTHELLNLREAGGGQWLWHHRRTETPRLTRVSFRLMEPYRQLERSSKDSDDAGIVRLIQEHPVVLHVEGEDGSVLDVLNYYCPKLFPKALAAGLSPDAGHQAPRQTLLQQAVCDSDLELIRLCLHYGADVERRNSEGETVLGYAASWASLEVVRLLVEAGANVNAIERSPDSFAMTALEVTMRDDRAEIRQYRRGRGAKTYRELTPTA